MKQTILLCVVSAVLGAGAVFLWQTAQFDEAKPVARSADSNNSREPNTRGELPVARVPEMDYETTRGRVAPDASREAAEPGTAANGTRSGRPSGDQLNLEATTRKTRSIAESDFAAIGDAESKVEQASAAEEVREPGTPPPQPDVRLRTPLEPPALPPALPEWGELTPEERVNIAIYQHANRSAVNIDTKTVQTDRFMLFEVPSEGEGSGTVIDRQGRILTNFHVIDGAREIQVTLWNGEGYPARLVGVDAATDTAVLKIDAPAEILFPMAFGNSASLLVGQRVFAIGNPFGLERTLTTGIISSLNRTLPARRTGRTIHSIIQIDAAINPGSSGGPLLDSHGRMIGMNTAIASRTGESAGVGFAIPVNTIARVVPQLIERGRVVRPDAGIERVYQTERGLLIAALTPGGPAEKAGLQGPRLVRQRRRQGPVTYETQTIDRSAADLIVAVDGQPVRAGDEFLSIIDAKQPGDRVVVTVVRQGQEVAVPVTLGEET